MEGSVVGVVVVVVSPLMFSLLADINFFRVLLLLASAFPFPTYSRVRYSAVVLPLLLLLLLLLLPLLLAVGVVPFPASLLLHLVVRVGK